MNINGMQVDEIGILRQKMEEINMNKFIPKHGSMEMWVVCTALGGDIKLLDKMKKNEDGSYPVVLSVGGVELDFNRFCKRLDEATQELAMEKLRN